VGDTKLTHANANGEAGYAALREGAGALELGRDVVRVSGPDAETYLQGQTSQDIAALPPGGWAWALVLQPQGKLDAFVRVFRVAADEYLLDSDAGMGPPLVARLTRFKLRTKVDVEQLPWRAVAVRGAGASALLPPAPGPALPPPAPGPPLPPAGAGTTLAVPFEWGGLTGYDLLGPAPAPPAGATAVEAAAYEAVRVEAGFPSHGHELDERTIPAEAGLVEAAVSFTKGCYTGQELVARIDSRGSNVPRRLYGLVLSGPVQAGARLYPLPVQEAAKEVGRLTSVAFSPRLGWVALGYVARAVQPGSAVMARDEEGEFEARVERLPLT
jgi:tRNA-modifying protein YgfZ